MTLFLAICLGIGLALGVGLRPFLPALLVGALARADVGIDFEGTDLSFLEDPYFLLALLIGALLFAGALGDDGYDWWPGLIGGLACAALAQATGRAFFRRIRARLDADASAALPVYAEAAGLVVAGLAVLLPPVSLVALAFLVWLLLGQRRREGAKYAGLRVLR